MLRAQGYYTAYKGKWHLSVINQKVGAGGKFPDATQALEDYGFSDYNYDGEHTGLSWAGFGHDGVTAAESINLLGRFSSGGTAGKPWFLAVNFVNPHDIMFFDAQGKGGAAAGAPMLGMPGTPLYAKDWGFELPRSYRADDLSTKPAVQRTFRPLDEAQLRVYQNYYFNCIRDVDQHVGAMLDAVEKLDFAHNTIVVVTADHGERGGAHGGMLGKGADIYKETVRVPLIVRHPDVRGGLTDALAGGIDLAPTLLGFAGLSDAERAQRYPDLHGVSLACRDRDAHARTARDERGILFDYGTPSGGVGPDGPAPTNTARGIIRGVFDGRYKFGRYFKISEHHEPARLGDARRAQRPRALRHPGRPRRDRESRVQAGRREVANSRAQREGQRADRLGDRRRQRLDVSRADRALPHDLIRLGRAGSAQRAPSRLSAHAAAMNSMPVRRPISITFGRSRGSSCTSRSTRSKNGAGVRGRVEDQHARGFRRNAAESVHDAARRIDEVAASSREDLVAERELHLASRHEVGLVPGVLVRRRSRAER